jgi:uncharacterized membrane protein
MKKETSVILLTIAGLLLIASGFSLLVFSSLIVLGLVAIITGFILIFLAIRLFSNLGSEWKSISGLDPNIRSQILNKAKEFAGIVTIQSVEFPKIASSHTHNVNVLGLDKTGAQVLVGIDPDSLEPVKLYFLCPRNEIEATEFNISQEQAMSACMEFLHEKSLAVPAAFELKESRVVEIGPWKRWRFVWRHYQTKVAVMPDFIMLEINATDNANVVSYSKVEHPLEVDLTAELSAEEAAENAKKLVPQSQNLHLSDATLSVVYPNNLFERQVWEWSDVQALCWVLRFERKQNHVMDIWIEAKDGSLLGGYQCHLHSPEVYGIEPPDDEHMKSHLDNIWTPFFQMIKFDASTFNWTDSPSGFPETTLSNSIATGKYFIVEAHGNVTDTAEKIIIAHEGDTDADAFTPEEVPTNNLRLALLDVCKSGHDGSGTDFKDTFISNGSDVFIGFDDYMCAWTYEESLLHYLSQGMHLANSHSLAVVEASPTYPIVITYNLSCLNSVRLAPLLVTVNRSPAGAIIAGQTFLVEATINNREDVDETVASNVQANLILPTGFSIVTGDNPQILGELEWNFPIKASWSVRAPISHGTFELDVEVTSDNLGVAVDDPEVPYHKFEVSVYYFIWKYIIALLEAIRRIFPYQMPQRKVGVEGRIMQKAR